MKERKRKIWAVLLLLFLITFALFSCFKQKPRITIKESPQVLITPPIQVKEKIGKKTTWLEERNYSGNKGYIVHDGAYVYFGHSTIERREVTLERVK